jgi:cation diffusion facilitator CzcD-associated flavoprotein CzcO
MADPDVDVLIVGAGISGVGAACHLTRDLPGRSYAILERRSAIGGTWDLFRYPGVRSDSDMYTFGYRFDPWLGTKVLADGASIREYVTRTADAYGVTDHVHFGQRVVRADWSSADGLWSVLVDDAASGTTLTWTCGFLFACTGYYDYDRGYRPDFPGEDAFRGTIVHPQHWPEDLDCRDKRVVVIGSGATAVTLVPALARDAAHVTMLQRSPGYIVALPARDKQAETLRRVFPDAAVYRLARARNIAIQRGLYWFARRHPDRLRRLVLAGARKRLGDSADLRHFTPRYQPWDQRLCIVPDGDLFTVIREGRADVVTDTVDTFTANGIRLASGDELDADVVVVATGLQVQVVGGAQLYVDGEQVAINECLTYKGVLVEDVPNAAIVFGYTNASWTLKADLAADYVTRLLRHMDAHGYTQVVARAPEHERTAESMMSSLNSGYVRRADGRLPRQGKRLPWRVLNNYLRDAPMLRHGRIDDGILQFTKAASPRLEVGV